MNFHKWLNCFNHWNEFCCMLSPGVRAQHPYTDWFAYVYCRCADERWGKPHSCSMVTGRCCKLRKHFVSSDFRCVSRVSLQSLCMCLCPDSYLSSLLACIHFWLIHKLSRFTFHSRLWWHARIILISSPICAYSHPSANSCMHTNIMFWPLPYTIQRTRCWVPNMRMMQNLILTFSVYSNVINMMPNVGSICNFVNCLHKSECFAFRPVDICAFTNSIGCRVWNGHIWNWEAAKKKRAKFSCRFDRWHMVAPHSSFWVDHKIGRKSHATKVNRCTQNLNKFHARYIRMCIRERHILHRPIGF